MTVRAHKDAPLRKLTTGLLRTYKLINERYYTAKKERQAKANGERRDADYQVTVGDLLGQHYKVVESMGKGSFGQVVSAEDTRDKRKVAVKVIKNREAFRRQAKTEIKLLEMLNRRDPDDQWCLGESRHVQRTEAWMVDGSKGPYAVQRVHITVSHRVFAPTRAPRGETVRNMMMSPFRVPPNASFSTPLPALSPAPHRHRDVSRNSLPIRSTFPPPLPHHPPPSRSPFPGVLRAQRPRVPRL